MKRSNFTDVLLIAVRIGSVNGQTLRVAARFLREKESLEQKSLEQKEEQVRDDGGDPPTQYH